MPPKPTGQPGSNQYQSRGSARTVDQRVAASTAASAVGVDVDAEAAAWAFCDKSAVWTEAGFEYTEAQEWLTLGVTADWARRWRRGGFTPERAEEWASTVHQDPKDIVTHYRTLVTTRSRTGQMSTYPHEGVMPLEVPGEPVRLIGASGNVTDPPSETVSLLYIDQFVEVVPFPNFEPAEIAAVQKAAADRQTDSRGRMLIEEFRNASETRGQVSTDALRFVALVCRERQTDVPDLKRAYVLAHAYNYEFTL